MGAGISSNVSEATSSVITSSVNKCKKGVASNELYLSGITHDPSPGCKTSSFNVNQSALVDADCFINSLQNNLVENVSKLTADAQAGIGVAVANNSSINKQNLESRLENICSGASSTNMVAAKDITSHSCDMTFVQNASAKTKCKIDAIQDAVVKTETVLASTATGASLGSLLFGGGIGGAVGGIVIVLILIAAAYAYYKYRSGGMKQMGGVDNFSLSDKKTYPVAIILTLLILVAVFVAYSRTNDTQLTVVDLTNFQSKLSEAKKIANLETTSNAVSNTVSDTRQSLSYNQDPIPNYYKSPQSLSYNSDQEPNYYKSPQVHNYESTQVQHHSSYPVQMVYQNPTDMFEQAYQTGPVYYNELKSYYDPLI